MILAKITFGKAGRRNPSDLEELALNYLAAALHNGQICGEYSYAWNKGTLSAYTHLANPAALAANHHTKWSLKRRREVIRSFGHEPRCAILEDVPLQKPGVWRKAPFLYLFTHAFDSAPPVSRGDTGVPVPSYLLPISYEGREQLYFWQANYGHHDHLWLASGALEIPAYRQLADPGSELSQHGRDLCRAIQRATGIPTFYYLMRYWGRLGAEETRRCPGCGRRWRTRYLGSEESPFWHFHFRCGRCRLVSHVGVSTDGGRHTRIGEYRGAREESEQAASPL